MGLIPYLPTPPTPLPQMRYNASFRYPSHIYSNSIGNKEIRSYTDDPIIPFDGGYFPELDFSNSRKKGRKKE